MRIKDFAVVLIVNFLVLIGFAFSSHAGKLEKEAEKLVNSVTSKKVIRCGDVWYAKTTNGGLVEAKNVKKIINNYGVSDVDRMNGIEWRGAYSFSATASRSMMQNGNWSQWLREDGMSFPYSNIMKVNGQWKIDGISQWGVAGSGHFSRFQDLTCNDVASMKTTQKAR